MWYVRAVLSVVGTNWSEVVPEFEREWGQPRERGVASAIKDGDVSATKKDQKDVRLFS